MLRRPAGFAAVLLLAAQLLIAAPRGARAEGRATAREHDVLQAIVAQLNHIRLAHGLNRLALSAALTRAAAQHTEEMGDSGYFAHASPDASPFWLRIRRWYPAAGCRVWSVGENLLWRSPDVSASQALTMWMNSPEHRANILDPSWRQLGISVEHFAAAPGAYADQPVTIVTTDFGVRCG